MCHAGPARTVLYARPFRFGGKEVDRVRSIASTWVAVFSMSLAACTGAAPTPGDDAGVTSCEPDRACPEGAPVWGGPCEGTLSCPFESCGGGSNDVYECVDGDWTLTMPAPCAGGSPPLAEHCRTPFSGSLDGARVWLSADAVGAPELHDGDTTEIAFGAQGFAMVPFRVHLDGVDPASAPSCVSVTTTLTLDAMTGSASTQQVRLRCGSSLRIQEILPSLPCEMRAYAIGIDVAVEGVGSVHLDLSAMGGMCPRGGG